jgi:release factor glutamine methyltransferase
MYSLIEIVKRSKQYVREGKGRPDFEVEEWIASCLHMKRLDIFLNHDRLMEESELELIKKGLSPLRQGEPLAYLLNKAHFWNDSFYISKGVLIPRPETESIVERALKVIKEHSFSSMADVCTGTGCIGLSLKKEIPSLRVCLIDLHEIPFQVARKNALDKELEVDVRKGDLLEPLHYQEVELIVSNPPYLSLQEWKRMDSSVRQFEPKEALIGGIQGIEIYEKLIHQSLQKGAKAMIVEIGNSQAEAVSSLFKKAGATSILVFKDLFQQDRGIEAHFLSMK